MDNKVKNANQRLKILYLYKILLERSDEEHSITMPEIISQLKLYGITAGRKALYEDIEALKTFGMDIVSERGHGAGYYVVNREFELPELKLLADAVSSSRFLTEKKSAELLKKLQQLTSVYEAKQIQRQVFVADRVKAFNERIKNLYDTYKDTESELRKFLDENEIFIDLKNETITIEGKEHSIHYGVKDFGLSNLEENLWSIGRKFYYDFCICGFFSVNSYRAYGGYVHISPEILYNISKICKTDLRNKWAKNHSAYMVSFLANKDELIDTITHKENATDKEFLEGLIYCAVNNAYFSVDEYDVLLKDDVSIPTSRIIDISEFDIWE